METTRRPGAGLDALLRPRSVAVVGASNDPSRIGGRPIRYMLARGYAGRIMPVNPNRSEVQGVPAYPDVHALPEVPDVAIVAVPGRAAEEAVAALGAKGTRAAIVFTAGYAEVGEEGAVEQARLLAAARAHGMRLLGPNCLGLFNAQIGFFGLFTASLESGYPPPGRVGVASQSGAYGTHLFACARGRGIGTPILVTTGNEADVTVADAIAWMVQDEETDVIMAYVEGVRDGDAFAHALAAARAARKPVVVVKVGRSKLGRQAAQSHTASLAGDDAVFDAVLAEHGAQRARTTEEMLDIAHLATRRIYPVRNTLGMITISGGAGVLVSDAAEELGLPMPPMPEEAQARLKALLPYSSPLNPVDCTAQAFNDLSLVRTFTEEMVTEGGYASVLAFFTQIGGAPSMAPRLRQELGAVRDAHRDRLCVLSVVASPEQVAQYEADGFAVFEDPSRATAAIAAMGRYGEAFARPPGGTLPVVPAVALPASTPTEAEVKRLLTCAGIPSAPERECSSAEEAVAAADRLGYPVVLKILSPDIPHKTEVGGVLLDVADPDAVRTGYSTLLARAAERAPGARIIGVLVAKQLRGRVECIMGIQQDPVFGPVAAFGLGGIFVEVLHDVALRRCPFDEAQAEQMVRSIRGAPILLGARGRPPADVPALARMLSRLSVLASQAGPRLRGLDLNPVLAMPEGEGAYALDAVMELESER